MIPQRINELIQILWNDVDSAADLQVWTRYEAASCTQTGRGKLRKIRS